MREYLQKVAIQQGKQEYTCTSFSNNNIIKKNVDKYVYLYEKSSQVDYPN